MFCYTPIMRVKDMNPMSYHANPLEDWVMKTFDELADQGPFGAGRVTLGFAFDLFFLPPEMIKALFARVKDKGVKTITNHGSVSLGNIVQSLKNLGKTSAQWLHASGIHTASELRRLGAVGAYRAVKRRGFGASRVLLYAIEGALRDMHWKDLRALGERLRLAILALAAIQAGQVIQAAQRVGMPRAEHLAT